jgi:hypothetical protein
MRGRRLWLRVQVHGGVIPVFVTKILEDDNGDDLDGYFDQDIPCVLIRQVENVSAMKQTLHHELLHVCFRGHSGTAREKILRGRTPDGRARREEDIISFLEPIQFDLLVRNGWLRYPSPPRIK